MEELTRSERETMKKGKRATEKERERRKGKYPRRDDDGVLPTPIEVPKVLPLLLVRDLLRLGPVGRPVRGWSESNLSSRRCPLKSRHAPMTSNASADLEGQEWRGIVQEDDGNVRGAE